MKRRAFLRGLGAAGGLAFAPALGAAAPAARGRAVDRLRDAEDPDRLAPQDDARGAPSRIDVEVDARRRSFGTARRPRRHADADGDAGRRETRRGRPVCRPSRLTPTSVEQHSLTLGFNAWSRDNYVVLPGFCYAGNRFQSRRPAYPPLLTEPADIGPHVPPIVPEIPRLSAGAGKLVVRRRHGRPGDARARRSCAGARSSASSCSSDRRRRAAAVGSR